MTTTKSNLWRAVALLTAVGLWGCQGDNALGPDPPLIGDGGGLFSVHGSHCTTTVTAPASIQAAVNAASSGDVICLSGTFSQSLTIPASKSRITLTSASNAVLDGTGPADAGTTLDANFAIQLLDGVSGVTIENLEIRDYPGSRGSAIQAWDVSTSGITVRNNSLRDNNWNGILVGSEGGFIHTNWMVKDNTVTNNGFVGIELTNCEHCAIVGNDVTAAPSGGVTGFNWGILVQARNTVSGSGNVTVNGVRVFNNDVTGASPGIGIDALALASDPTPPFDPILVASSTLSSVMVKSNRLTGNDLSVVVRGFIDGTAFNNRVVQNDITCASGGTGVLVLNQSGGTAKNTKVVNNSFSSCLTNVSDGGDATKVPPAPGPVGP